MNKLRLHFDEYLSIFIFIILSFFAVYTEFAEVFFNYTKDYEDYELDESLGILLSFSLVLAFYSHKKYLDLKHSKELFYKLSTSDTLTGLLNREAFFNDLKETSDSYVVLVNIIDFKSINKVLGFAKSDEFLKVFSTKLFTISLNNKALNLYRLYGDEFALILDKKFDIHETCENITKEFEQNSITFEKNDFHISINLSYSDIEPKFLTATLAMQECKKSLDKNIVSYKKEYYNLQENKDTLNMLTVIKNAIFSDDIIPVYHSIIDNKTQEIYKYETLARIKQKNNELLSPYFFIELSKKFKLYPSITKNIIKKSFNDFKHNNMNFSINFSYLDIHNEQILNYFYKILKDNVQTAKRLTIEILETENITSYEELLSFRHMIKKYGCKLAIDDFGAGYSNWINILQIKPDFIKLDGSLIQNLLLTNESKNLVKSIVSFSRENNIKTIAEYVSNKELAILVNELGIDYSQGYYYSQPVEINKIEY